MQDIHPDTYPRAQNGLTLPLSKSLDLQELCHHREKLGRELEALAKKYDRFAWDRDRGSWVHDRLLLDWMDRLQDYTIEEVRAAIRKAVVQGPNRMPHEGHILNLIAAARAAFLDQTKFATPRAEVVRPNDTPARREERCRYGNTLLAERGFGTSRPAVALAAVALPAVLEDRHEDGQEDRHEDLHEDAI